MEDWRAWDIDADVKTNKVIRVKSESVLIVLVQCANIDCVRYVILNTTDLEMTPFRWMILLSYISSDRTGVRNNVRKKNSAFMIAQELQSRFVSGQWSKLCYRFTDLPVVRNRSPCSSSSRTHTRFMFRSKIECIVSYFWLLERLPDVEYCIRRFSDSLHVRQ